MSIYNDMEYQKLRAEFVRKLAILYLTHPLEVALVCDGAIDPSGDILGKVRNAALDMRTNSYTRIPTGEELSAIDRYRKHEPQS